MNTRLYTKNGQVAGGTLVIPEENRRIVNARHEQWLHYGWTPYTPAVREPSAQDLIAELKAQLAEGDYKVTKNAELLAIGQPCAYDPEELHNERQALRDKINALEQENEP